MRRREVSKPSPRIAAVPDELLECVVEDWVDPSETFDPPDDRMGVAWGRYRRARREWLDSQRIDRREECSVIPNGRPISRDDVVNPRQRSKGR